MTTSTLNPPTKSAEVNLNQIVGGIVGGTFEAFAEPVLGTPPPSYEAREQITTSVPEYIQKAFSSGEINNFKTPKFNPEIHRKTLEAQLAKAHQEVLTTVPITAKRIDVNTKFFAGTGNVLYEDTVSDDGTVRRDVETHLSRLNSELEAKQLKAKREKQLVRATTKRGAPKGAVGPVVNLNTAFEDQNLNRPG